MLAMMVSFGLPAHADRDRNCEQHIRKAESKLQQAIHKHGARSRQAEQRRRELEEVRERCRHR
jgi:hypothetical protein